MNKVYIVFDLYGEICNNYRFIYEFALFSTKSVHFNIVQYF